MQKYEIQKLRDLPIERVAEQMGIKVERHKALCPFHDDHHASLSFNTRKNSCRCYVCMGNSVGTIDLVMKYLGKDFLSACRWLAEVNAVYLEEGRERVQPLPLPPKPLLPVVLIRERIPVALIREMIPVALLRVVLQGNPPPLMPASMRDSLSIRG